MISASSSTQACPIFAGTSARMKLLPYSRLPPRSLARQRRMPRAEAFRLPPLDYVCEIRRRSRFNTIGVEKIASILRSLPSLLDTPVTAKTATLVVT
jgi:hypothetical protein